MSYEDYWHGAAELVVYQRKAENIRLSRKNQQMWLQGLYVHAAVAASIGRQIAGDRQAEYPKEPVMLWHEQEAKKERERQKAIAFFNAFAIQHKQKEGG